LKIWIDILTPKQLLFFQPIIKKLERNHKLLCTSRFYREVTQLAKIRKLNLVMIGKHGGAKKYDKLNVSIERMGGLLNKISKFSPDITISFCSPEASRISFGLGIKHIAFSNAPHAEAAMRLSVPFIQKLLTPWLIPKTAFAKYGISKRNIIHYKAMDEYNIIKGKSHKKTVPKLKRVGKKTILFRTYEAQASYIQKKKIKTVHIIREISKEFPNINIVVLGRYSDEIKELKKELGKKIIVLNNTVDSGEILSLVDIFIGSGGTMTQEAALRGVRTISYDAVPNLDEKFLVRKGLVYRGKDSKQIIKLIKKLLNSDKNKIKKKAKKFLDSMEDPYNKLTSVLRLVTE